MVRPFRSSHVRKDCVQAPGSIVGRVLLLVLVMVMVPGLSAAEPAATIPPPSGASPAAGALTFNRDIAPLIYQRCASCHRPGEPAPFNLLTYADVRKHAQDIVEVTGRRYMPPWMPDDGDYAWLDNPRLSAGEIQRIAQWVASGMVEGRAEDLPPPPRWADGWKLGTPDLVVTMPEPFTLPADGKDVYRNFVIPVPLTSPRYVRGYEFRPGSRAVHHAFIRIDTSGQARRLDDREPELGFGGMDLPPSAESPSGHFLGWQPGRRPYLLPDGLSWTLPARSDVVLLMHLQPQGRPERVQPSIGFYFTDVGPTNVPIKIGLRSYAIDIPAGATNYSLEETVKLPADANLLAVAPHAHYLARRVEGFAVLPDGTRKTLLTIPDWDFNWQGEFRYANPVRLPRGTVVGMRFTYDNSTNNVRNPNHPPARVQFGLQTSDEMGELWFQFLGDHPKDREALMEAAQLRLIRDIGELSRFRLRQDPTDADSTAELGKVLLTEGNIAGAETLFRRALQLRPSADAHYHLGCVLMERSRIADAGMEFLAAIRLDPEHFQSHNNAGLCFLSQGRLAEAQDHFREVLRLHPGDPTALANLELVERARAQQAPRP